MGAKPSTIAEEAVDQLQENEKLVAGKASHSHEKEMLEYKMMIIFMYIS